MVIQSLTQIVSPFGKVNLVTSLMVHRLLLIIIFLLVKQSGMYRQVLLYFFLMVWMDKVLNILQEEWKDSSKLVMMILILPYQILKHDSEDKEEKLTGKWLIVHFLQIISMLFVDKCIEISGSPSLRSLLRSYSDINL